MKKMKLICAMTLCMLVSMPTFADPSNLNKLIPLQMEKQGWVLEDEPIIAPDEATLSMIINGAAPRYMELGTKQAAFVNYEKKDVFLMLEIYETGSQKNAQALYAEYKTGSSNPVTDLGNKARLTSEMGGTYMLEYCQDRFYVRISITHKSQEAKTTILDCAKKISGLIAGK
jgi:hypothetical protein